MRFSICTDMLGSDSFEESLQHAKALGFSSVDLRAKLDGYTLDNIPYEEARVIKQKVDEAGLEVSCLSSWAVNSCSFSGPAKYDNYDENHHQAMEKVLDRLFDLADIFDTPYVRVYSLHRKEGFEDLSEADKDAEYRHNASILARHAEHARKRNKTILVENEPPTLSRDARELGLLARYADHPNLKINWDIINGWRAGEFPTLEAYEHVKGYVWQTHLKGANRAYNTIDEQHPHGLFGNFSIAGRDDFAHGPLMQAIAKHDPQATMTIDTHYPSFYQQDQIGEVEVVRLTKLHLEALVNGGDKV
ncbi:3-dehydroshikimate dehydratase [compost metagenome]